MPDLPASASISQQPYPAPSPHEAGCHSPQEGQRGLVSGWSPAPGETQVRVWMRLRGGGLVKSQRDPEKDPEKQMKLGDSTSCSCSERFGERSRDQQRCERTAGGRGQGGAWVHCTGRVGGGVGGHHCPGIRPWGSVAVYNPADRTVQGGAVQRLGEDGGQGGVPTTPSLPTRREDSAQRAAPGEWGGGSGNYSAQAHLFPLSRYRRHDGSNAPQNLGLGHPDHREPHSGTVP